VSYDYSVVIGRFSPIHLAHYRLIRYALSQADQTIIFVGSDEPRSLKNPWLADERIEMIRACFTDQAKRIHFIPLKDVGNDEKWKASLMAEYHKLVGEAPKSTLLVACNKDQTSYYLKLFEEFRCANFQPLMNVNATDIRRWYFTDPEKWNFIDDSRWKQHLDPITIKYLERFRKIDAFQEVMKLIKKDNR
jgi:bifunctional NMN adenylyltransferase/nudix hydrolase